MQVPWRRRELAGVNGPRTGREDGIGPKEDIHMRQQRVRIRNASGSPMGHRGEFAGIAGVRRCDVAHRPHEARAGRAERSGPRSVNRRGQSYKVRRQAPQARLFPGFRTVLEGVRKLFRSVVDTGRRFQARIRTRPVGYIRGGRQSQDQPLRHHQPGNIHILRRQSQMHRGQLSDGPHILGRSHSHRRDAGHEPLLPEHKPGYGVGHRLRRRDAEDSRRRVP